MNTGTEIGKEIGVGQVFEVEGNFVESILLANQRKGRALAGVFEKYRHLMELCRSTLRACV